MIRSPGAAASIADWMVLPAAKRVGGLPPMVTVTESIDCWPLAAVMTSSPHLAAGCPCCCLAHRGTLRGTVQVMERSPLPHVAATPPIVTLALAPKP